MSEHDMLLKKIMAYSFAAFEWNLYLDTHPNDQQGIAMQRQMVKKANECKAEYTSKYGPLVATESTNTNFWDWIDEPWPWEM